VPKGLLEPIQIRTGVTANDIILVKDLPNAVNPGGNAVTPGTLMFGTLLDYPSAGGASAGEVQYVRLRLPAGLDLKGMVTFIESGGSPNVFVRMGLYDQVDPADQNGDPNNRVAQTLAVSTQGTANVFVSLPFDGGNYVVPVTGFYWLAIVTDSPNLKFAVSATHRSNFLPVRHETQPGQVSTLPSVSTNPTNPVSAVVYVAAEEQL
jgi:hypothetical protein